ncbi:hypothetical protein [Limosilactobacillus fermentum]|nr:hypothetical protein [Limosilactobacillus fermentum]UOG12439.1 hypothetical protein MRD09_07295 [Limosilactobacillus fermentum]
MHEAYNQSRALAEITHAFQTTVWGNSLTGFLGFEDTKKDAPKDALELNITRDA